MTSHDPHRQHPPGVPYTGGYLENIWAIDNGQNTFTPEGLVNFAKMTAVSLNTYNMYIIWKNVIITY